MNIGIVDADLLNKKNHRFPNLALMKIAGFYKEKGHEIELITSYSDIIHPFFKKTYDKIYISKVFTDTIVPNEVLLLKNVEYGGSGFYFDKATKLPKEIEHHFPYYDLYNKWMDNEMRFKKKKKKEFKNYTDYSIGFTTRGCIRQCSFCVNRNEKYVYLHSPINEFYDEKRKKICLLDDNIFGLPKKWKDVFEELIQKNVPFTYNQGLDIRLLTNEKAKILSKCKYDGDYIFAFDNYKDKDIIEKKIKIFKSFMPNKVPKFYVFCAYDGNDVYDYTFWIKDVSEIFERLKILMKYKCLPYLMRFEKHKKSPLYDMYVLIAMWCNQPNLFKKLPFMSVVQKNKKYFSFKRKYPELVDKYFNLKFGETEQ